MGVRAIVLAATLLSMAGCGSQTPQRTASDWQAMTRHDLDAAHAIIRSAHPGAIDSENPHFNDWVKSGYEQAISIIPHVVDYNTMLSAVRFYTTGFRDGHLMYSDDTRHDDNVITVTGWRLEESGGRLKVVQTLDDWPVPLPPLGAELVECDGKAPDSIIRDDIAPFVTRRVDSAARQAQVESLWVLHMPGHELHRCKFHEGDGQEVERAVAYRALKAPKYFAAIAGQLHRVDNKENSYARLGDVLWVRAANFNLQPGTEQVKKLEEMLAGLSNQTGFNIIVFDVRGNSGGDSSIGSRIFNAATGGIEFDQIDMERLPQTHAQWRVSDLLLSTARQRASLESALYGTDSTQAREAALFLESVVAAKAEGRTWVEQKGGYRLTRGEIAARHGKLRGFGGTIAVVTDSGCASACLDFADLVKQVPGSLHLGSTTGSDTVYMDMGGVELPSGNHLRIPLKVWRNRLRGNNEAYVPDINFSLDMGDDAAVQSAVLTALGKRATVSADLPNVATGASDPNQTLVDGSFSAPHYP